MTVKIFYLEIPDSVVILRVLLRHLGISTTAISFIFLFLIFLLTQTHLSYHDDYR